MGIVKNIYETKAYIMEQNGETACSDNRKHQQAQCPKSLSEEVKHFLSI